MKLFKSFLGLSVFGLSLVLGAQVEAQTTVDTPMPLELGITSKVTLDQNESAYFKAALPADDIRVILDTAVAATDDNDHNLISSLSVLDKDGGVVQSNAIGFNQIDVCWRKVAYFTLKKPATMGFKLTNSNAKAYFWITVSKKSDLRFVPLYGNIVPTPIVVGSGKTALLAHGENVFYTAALPKGEYKAIAELANVRAQPLNISGYLAFLDGDGGSQETLIGFNEIDVTFRKTGGFTVKKDSTFVFRVHNTSSASMNSLVKIAPAE